MPGRRSTSIHAPTRVVVGLIHPRPEEWRHRGPSVLLFRRSFREGVEFPGMWCFPGGKVEHLETDLRALRRELSEEVSIQVGRAKRVFDRPIVFTPPLVRKTCHLHVFRVMGLYRGTPEAGEPNTVVTWATPATIRSFALTPGTKVVLDALGSETFG